MTEEPLYNRAKNRASTAPHDSLAFKIWWLLDRYNITPTEIERRGGPTRSFLSHVFNGERQMSYDQLVKFTSVMPFSKAERQWLFITNHWVIPEWEGSLHDRIAKQMRVHPDAKGP